ncbi:hypothetical protein B0T26DRAFT_735275 [Lasiosphaeria miniovina]|uniref:Secreted protein n=1 Tax=Lasiosphaeria miniovina TaxID=1954250 RepID=A0AA40DID1_9PEZI|nr:uncharacterized protein B0T26DRAFT_735275 [Lasiosphaeria miniovina]KAK0701932.1 hypothetical protein B0T26DRAFT_735275 [Lasiosphaeria miniovina]
MGKCKKGKRQNSCIILHLLLHSCRSLHWTLPCRAVPHFEVEIRRAGIFRRIRETGRNSAKTRNRRLGSQCQVAVPGSTTTPHC